jgi:hypothetical protein
MKKVIFLVVTCLALIATVGAASYTAKVDIQANSTVGNTQDAELAMIITDGAISTDFLSYSGTPTVVLVDFQTVQRNSSYDYDKVLKVTNNKPYAVKLMVSNVTGPLGVWSANFQFVMEGGTRSDGDEARVCLWTSDSGNNGNFIMLQPQGTLNGRDSALVDFLLVTRNGAPSGAHNGTITFRATATIP